MRFSLLDRGIGKEVTGSHLPQYNPYIRRKHPETETIKWGEPIPCFQESVQQKADHRISDLQASDERPHVLGKGSHLMLGLNCRDR